MTEHPLSPAQQAIWFEDQIDDGTGNTGFFGVTLLGELNEDHIAAACAAAVARHTTMRTLLKLHNGRPYLAVLPETTPLRYEVADRPCAPGEETAATRDWRDRNTVRRFDLAAAPPVTFTLLRHGPDRRSLLVVAHHIGYDGRSKFVFARTFAAALTDLRAGRVPDTSALPWPQWPAARDEAVAGASAYWQAADVESYPSLRLPRRTGEGGNAIGDNSVSTTGEFFVDGDTRAKLVTLAHSHGVSLFAVMLAGVAITLYGYGNSRMVLCAPVDVTTTQTRDLIGLGVNIVPFTLAVEDTDTVGSVLAKAAGVRAHLKAYGAVPFQLLSVGKGWSAGSRALFSRLGVSYLRMATDVPEIPGLATRWDFVAHNTARTFDLTIHMRDAYNRMVVRLDYVSREVDGDATAAHLRGVLASLADRPTMPLRALALLPAESSITARAGTPRPLSSVTPFSVVRRMARTGFSVPEVVTPMADLRPSAEIVAMIRAGVRLRAVYTTADETVAFQSVTADDLADGYTPILRDLEPGVAVSVQGPHGQTLPYGVIGDLVVNGERTGDLAEIDSSGTMRFHGPAAQTVEWAGQRLEIAAVERYLMAHPDIDEAVVVCADHRPIAFVVPRNGRLDERAVRLHLRGRTVAGEPRLSRIHVVSGLPRRPDGEVDRDALRDGGS